jgi:hypothetical protein
LASFREFDDVIDPAQTRDWVIRALRSLPAPQPVSENAGRSSTPGDAYAFLTARHGTPGVVVEFLLEGSYLSWIVGLTFSAAR